MFISCINIENNNNNNNNNTKAVNSREGSVKLKFQVPKLSYIFST